MDTSPTAETYESKIAIYRYMNVLAIIPLVMFLVWWASDLTPGTFYFLAIVIAYLCFVVTKVWFIEREYFDSIGPVEKTTTMRRAKGATIRNGSGIGINRNNV